MRLLFDTHTFLWFINGDPNLSGCARRHIENLENRRLPSTASLCKIGGDYRYLHIDFPVKMCYEAVSAAASQQHCAENTDPHNPSLKRTADAAA